MIRRGEKPDAHNNFEIIFNGSFNVLVEVE